MCGFWFCVGVIVGSVWVWLLVMCKCDCWFCVGVVVGCMEV